MGAEADTDAGSAGGLSAKVRAMRKVDRPIGVHAFTLGALLRFNRSALARPSVLISIIVSAVSISFNIDSFSVHPPIPNNAHRLTTALAIIIQKADHIKGIWYAWIREDPH